MATFYVFEIVPVYVSYRKTIEADNAEQAIELARDGWGELDSLDGESEPMLGDCIEAVPVTYEVEEA